MARRQNTDRNGNQFSEAIKREVWNRAQIIPGVDPNLRRKDRCGAYIEWNQHGITIENGTGWEVDHIRPVSSGGGDDIQNLQPLQWQNNRRKGDDFPANPLVFCIIKAM